MEKIVACIIKQMKIKLNEKTIKCKKETTDPGRDRTCNLLLRRQTRYPLRHRTDDEVQMLVLVVI